MLGLTHRAGPARRRGGLTLLVGALALASVGSLLTPAHGALAAPATATSDLSLRAGPGAEYEVLTVIPAGAAVSVDGDAVNGYFPVTFDGISGWAAAEYVALGGGEAAPVAKDLVAAPADAAAPQPTEPIAEPAAEPADEPPAAAETAAPPSAPVGAYGEQEIIRIIHEAADRYGQPREDMVRVARCESGLNPNAVDPAGLYYGLYQFVPSTFAGTPYGQYDIFDPWANAHAAAWMWSEGRRGEWVCQ